MGSWIGKPRGWERVVRWFAPPEQCAALGRLRVVREGTVFLAQATTPVGWNVLLFGTYEPELRALFRRLLPEGGIALDVGANVGWHALLLSNLVGPAGRVLAVEPNPSVRERLEENLRANRADNVTILPFALAEEDRRAPFHGPAAELGESGSGHLLADPQAGSHEDFEVEVRRADAVLTEARVERLDLVKIDVEGFEWAVLAGARDSIARHRPHVFFEYNADYVGRAGGDPVLFEEFFRDLGYRLFEVGRRGELPIPSGSWPGSADVWARPDPLSATASGQ